jgi:general stress protein 26
MTLTQTEMSLDEVLSVGDVVMLTSAVDDATALQARPLTCVAVEGELVAFLVSADDAWVDELADAGRAAREVVLTRDKGGRYVALSGHAVVTAASSRVTTYWSRMADAYFDGPDDPRIRILDVQVHGGEWWDAPTSGVGSLLAMVGTFVLRRPVGADGHGPVDPATT